LSGIDWAPSKILITAYSTLAKPREEPDLVSGIERGCKLHAGDIHHRQYWKVFLRDNARYVPQPASAWNVSRSEKLDNSSKTVKVIWRFAHK